MAVDRRYISGGYSRQGRRAQWEALSPEERHLYAKWFPRESELYREPSVRAGGVQITVDTARMVGHINRVFARFPVEADRALRRATSLFRTKCKRMVLQAMSDRSGVPQKYWADARHMRVYVAIDRYGSAPLGVDAWIGTNPIPVHRLGNVQWAQRSKRGRVTKGARVQGRLYPGTWAWGRGKTGPAVMRRRAEAARLPIQIVAEEPHPVVAERLSRLAPVLAEFYHTRLKEQLNFALNLEGKK